MFDDHFTIISSVTANLIWKKINGVIECVFFKYFIILV